MESIQSWMIENKEGVFVLKRHGNGYIVNITDFLDDEYSLEKIASKSGDTTGIEEKFLGSLKTEIRNGEVWLHIIKSNKFVQSLQVENLYQIIHLNEKHSLIGKVGTTIFY